MTEFRSMKCDFREYDHSDPKTYKSSFDPDTGTLVREVDLPDDWCGKIPRSPSPETVDIAITNRCGFGCSYCYQDSTSKAQHGADDLVERILLGFTHVPYQIAIGGGEPTLHPKFTNILRGARELGTVPNYTTAGHNLTPAIIEATNEVCGGVAMTYHAFKGQDWFIKHYNRLRLALKCQVNVHLIADKDVATNLDFLVSIQDQVGPISVVLLAYYPDVGRASMDSLLTKSVYMRKFPDAIKRAVDSDMKIAYSEGLIPFFFSRPELPIETDFAIQTEGNFSCYFNHLGECSHSSFSDDYVNHNPYQCKNCTDNEKCTLYGRETLTVWDTTSQNLWDTMSTYSNNPRGSACFDCKFHTRCSVPHDHHYFNCAYASHNKV